MPFVEVLILAVGLGADAFSVAAGVAVCWYGGRQMFRLAFHFGLFQFFMPLIGWILGSFALPSCSLMGVSAVPEGRGRAYSTTQTPMP